MPHSCSAAISDLDDMHIGLLEDVKRSDIFCILIFQILSFTMNLVVVSSLFDVVLVLITMHRLSRVRRAFLPDGKTVDRALSTSEIMCNELKQKFSATGRFDKKKITEEDLYEMWQNAKPGSADDYRAGCYAMNLYYNFGRTMKHKHITDRFLQMATKTEQWDECIDLLKYYKGWLDHPPTRKTVYELLNKLVEQKEWMKVREAVATVRENWQMVPTASLYKFGIEAMLQIDDNPCKEAVKIYDDSQACNVKLPLALHVSVLEATLGFSDDNELPQRIAERMYAEVETMEPSWRETMVFSWGSWRGLSLKVDKSWQELFEVGLSNYNGSDGFVPSQFFLALHASDREASSVLLEKARGVLGDVFPELPADEVSEEDAPEVSEESADSGDAEAEVEKNDDH
eukprot:gene521-957_t